MTLILSGTNGVSDVDGSASTPAIRGSDSNTGIFFPAADTIAFATGGAEVARFDSSGNLGIGTSSPVSRLRVKQKPTNGFTDGLSMQRNDTADTYEWVVGGDNGLYLGYANNASGADAPGDFSTRMIIDSSGNLLVGTTSFSSGRINAATASGLWGIAIRDTAANTAMIQFVNSAGAQAGSITISGTTTNYGSGSDYRLKENIAPMTGALEKVQALKPVTWKWKADGSDGQGFIAHELSDVYPDAVVGEKDAVNEDGSIKPQMVDTSFLVATLTAAIQEQQALIESLTARIAALEAA